MFFYENYSKLFFLFRLLTNYFLLLYTTIKVSIPHFKDAQKYRADVNGRLLGTPAWS
jgi:hypothetical protein